MGPAPPFWQQTFCFKSDIENLILKESTHLRITGKLTTLTLKLNFKVINPLPTDLRKGGGFFFFGFSRFRISLPPTLQHCYVPANTHINEIDLFL